MSELKRTQLYETHVAAGASMVDFGGWEMPVQYPTGIVAEHLYTRHTPEKTRRRMELYDQMLRSMGLDLLDQELLNQWERFCRLSQERL